jgi:Protein of unknown function (DUF4232)
MTLRNHSALRLAAVAALAVTGSLLAACGSTTAPGASSASSAAVQPSSPTTPASSPASVSPSAGTGCLASDLQAQLGASQGTAGTIYQVIVLVNTSSSTCTLYGYPGVSFVTGVGGAQIGAPASKSATQASSLVSLAPGAKANALLAVHDAGAFPNCKVTGTDWLRIYPPGDYGSVYVQYKTQACANMANPTMSVTTVAAGAGSASG